MTFEVTVALGGARNECSGLCSGKSQGVTWGLETRFLVSEVHARHGLAQGMDWAKLTVGVGERVVSEGGREPEG